MIKKLALLFLLAVVGMGGVFGLSPGLVQAIPVSTLASLSFKDVNGNNIDLPDNQSFIPGDTSYDFKYYDDMPYILLHAAPTNPMHSVRVKFDDQVVAAPVPPATDFRVDIPPYSHHKLIKVEVLNGDTVLNTYSIKLWLSMRGGGTEADPYRIVTADQLSRINITTDIGVYQYNGFAWFKLMNDIDMTGYLNSSIGNDNNQGWKPFDFYGKFDGNYKTIRGLWINRSLVPSSPSDNTYNGLFGHLGSATIKNLNIELAPRGITGISKVGGLAGSTYDGSITNVSVTGNVYLDSSNSSTPQVGGVIGVSNGTALDKLTFIGNVQGKQNTGGLIGNLTLSSKSLTNSNAEGNVAGTDDVGGAIGVLNSGTVTSVCAAVNVTGSINIGGLIGHVNNSNNLSKVCATGSVTYSSSPTTAVGGLAGYVNSATISEAYSTGSVNGISQVGGLLGYLGSGSVTDSYSTGSVTGFASTSIGGLIGQVASSSPPVFLTNTFAAGAVSGILNGGLSGNAWFAEWMNSYWDTETTRQNNSTGTSGVYFGFNTAKMKEQITYTDWDFTTVWVMHPNSYPKLRWAIPNTPPQSPTLLGSTVAENQPTGTAVGTLSAVDPDDNETFTYTLVSGSGDEDNGKFTIDGALLKTAEAFDFETKASYSVRIQVADSKGATAAQALTITVTDVNEAPTALNLAGDTVDENAPVGTVVGMLSGTDPDAGAVLTYQLVSGEGDVDNGSFIVNGNALVTNDILNYEVKNDYNIRASVSDSVYAKEQTFTIFVRDLPESPSELMLSQSKVPENSPNGTIVGTFSSSIPNANSTNIYTLDPGVGDADNGSFTISGNQLLTNSPFDYESKDVYRIRVAVADSVYGAVYSYSKSFTITVLNVNEPTTNLLLSKDTIAENLPPGTAVGTLSAVDPDQGETYQYQLVAGDGSEDNGSFTIAGAVLRTGGAFDFEAKAEYRIRIAVTDEVYEANRYEKSFVIRVTDVNESVEPDNNPDPATPQSPPTAPPAQKPEVEVIVNGDRENQLAQAAVDSKDGQTTITVSLLPDKIADRLAQEGERSVITIPVTTGADKVVGELNGQTVKLMEGKQATLVIETGAASYVLPAAQISIDAVSAKLGREVSLSDIKVQVQIATGGQAQTEQLQLTANQQPFVAVTDPLNFTIQASYNGQTVDIDKFQSYVEREIALPEGVDPNKITTGIILQPDGTVTHVPTFISARDGRYYARINSLTNSAYSVIWNPQSFPDAAGHWAQAQINNMASRKIVNGTDAFHFDPDRSITRAELASILVRALGLAENGGTASFSDVKKTDWYYGAVAQAREYGIVQGYENGTFRPEQMVTREQAMSMLNKAMSLAGLTADVADPDRSLQAFADRDQVSEWAKPSVAAAVQAGLVSGRTTGLAPKETITRAETAMLVYQLLVKAKLINELR